MGRGEKMGICLLVSQLPTARLMPENRAGAWGSQSPSERPLLRVRLGTWGCWAERGSPALTPVFGQLGSRWREGNEVLWKQAWQWETRQSPAWSSEDLHPCSLLSLQDPGTTPDPLTTSRTAFSSGEKAEAAHLKSELAGSSQPQQLPLLMARL